MNWIDQLKQMQPCPEAVKWARHYPTLESAWAACERGDWMLWLLERNTESTADRQRIALCVCDCARTATLLYMPGNEHLLKTIGSVESLARRGKATEAATAAAIAAAFASAGTVADAATAVAIATAFVSAGTVVDIPLGAAFASCIIAAPDVYDKVYDAVIEKYADLIRKHYPTAPRFKTIKERGT